MKMKAYRDELPAFNASQLTSTSAALPNIMARRPPEKD
jgi:hypothetical protein